MGPETEMPNCSVYHNGEFIGFFSKDMELPELSIPEPVERGADSHMELFGFNCKAVVSKEWKCRSRKRFVKLLMKHGYGRNHANRLAAVIKAGRGRMSYQCAIFLLIFWGIARGGENET